ncbi:MAG: alpha/beta hydrolase [Verrucomicrobiota bacterium]
MDLKNHKTMDGAVSEVYKTIGDVELKAHIFNPEGHKPSDRRPAAVFFFGGGWNSGTPLQFKNQCLYLASRGMVAMAMDYRVKSRNKTTPFECVKDGKSAVRWVRTNAKRLGIDPDRIAAGGGSAGGHVAAATGTVPGLEEAGEDQTVSPRPNALLLFNPVYDNGPNGYGYNRVKERFKEISPMHNIDRSTPPAIVFLGSRDKLIPVSTAETFKKKMEDAGVKSVLHVYEGQAHGFFNPWKGGPDVFRKTMQQLDAFLVELGYLDGSRS